MSQEKCCFKGILGLFVRGTPGFRWWSRRRRRRLCGFACFNFLLGIKLGELCDRCVSSIPSLIGARAAAAAAAATTTKRTKRKCGNSSKKKNLFKKVSDFKSRQLFLKEMVERSPKE